MKIWRRRRRNSWKRRKEEIKTERERIKRSLQGLICY